MRMVYHVGRPAILEGNKFLPLTGMPILKTARISVLLAVWLPEPLTVAATIAKSFTIGGRSSGPTVCGLVEVSMMLMCPDSTDVKTMRNCKGCCCTVGSGPTSTATPFTSCWPSWPLLLYRTLYDVVPVHVVLQHTNFYYSTSR